MAVPRNRLSNARKNSKRSHHAKSPKSLVACVEPECDGARMPHRLCPKCGSGSSRSRSKLEQTM